MKNKLSPLIVALDLPDLAAVQKTVASLGDSVDFYKVGLRLFIHYGPKILEFLKKKNKKIFLDLKLHDIPNTVAEACREIVPFEVELTTLHTFGGLEMLQAAKQAVKEEARRLKVTAPQLLGVTVLTSTSDLKEFNIKNTSVASQVGFLATIAAKAQLEGLVSSPWEVKNLRKKYPKSILVTPGIRLEAAISDDQKRIMAPGAAFQAGSSAIVVGRPILQAQKPRDVVARIMEAHHSALHQQKSVRKKS